MLVFSACGTRRLCDLDVTPTASASRSVRTSKYRPAGCKKERRQIVNYVLSVSTELEAREYIHTVRLTVRAQKANYRRRRTQHIRPDDRRVELINLHEVVSHEVLQARSTLKVSVFILTNLRSELLFWIQLFECDQITRRLSSKDQRRWRWRRHSGWGYVNRS